MDNTPMSEIILSDKNISEEILKNDTPILIDFWAEWCVPCKMIAPMLEEISKDFGDKIRIGKLNVEQNPSASNYFTIKAIPTLILFFNKKIVKRFIGVQSKKTIVNAVNLLLTNKKI